MDRGKRIYVKGGGSLTVLLAASAGAFTQAVLDAGDRVIATARKPEQLVGA